MRTKLLPKAPDLVDIAAVEEFGSQSESDFPVFVDDFGEIRRFVGTEFDTALSHGFGICKLLEDRSPVEPSGVEGLRSTSS